MPWLKSKVKTMQQDTVSLCMGNGTEWMNRARREEG